MSPWNRPSWLLSTWQKMLSWLISKTKHIIYFLDHVVDEITYLGLLLKFVAISFWKISRYKIAGAYSWDSSVSYSPESSCTWPSAIRSGSLYVNKADKTKNKTSIVLPDKKASPASETAKLAWASASEFRSWANT